MANIYGNFSAKSITETCVNVPSNTWTALPTTAMGDRNYVRIYNKGEYKLYLSFDSSAAVQHRMAIAGGDMIDFPIQDTLTLYGRSGGTGSVRVIIQEFK